MRGRVPRLALGHLGGVTYAGRGSNGYDDPRSCRSPRSLGGDRADPVFARDHRFRAGRIADPGGVAVLQHLGSGELGLRTEQTTMGSPALLRADLHRAADRCDRELLQREYGEDPVLVAGAGRHLHRTDLILYSLDIERPAHHENNEFHLAELLAGWCSRRDAGCERDLLLRKAFRLDIKIR